MLLKVVAVLDVRGTVEEVPGEVVAVIISELVVVPIEVVNGAAARILAMCVP